MAKTKKLSGPYSDYEVSSDGTVYSTKGSERSKVATRKDDDGYERVNLSNSEEKNGFKTFRVHDLVAKAFLGPRPDGAEVLHKDGNKSNNSASNLEYGSKSKNAEQREEKKRADGQVFWRVDSPIKLGAWEVTPEGYLKATAVVARVGPLVYKTPEGDRTEYVTEEALKNDAASLIGKPVTFEHPPSGEVNADNYTQYSKGEVVNAEYDEALKAQVAEILVKDRKTIDAILKYNIVEVSPGYRATVVKDRRSDAPYKFKQVKRYNNHLAITRAGRGGPESAIRLDSEGHAIIIPREDAMDEENKKKMDALEKENADMKKKMDAMEAKLDAYEKMAEKKKDEEEEEEKNDSLDPQEFVRLFNERTEALELAKMSDVQVDSTWTNEELKSAIVKKHLGNEVRCDSAESLQGAYEAVAKMAPKRNSADHLSATFQRNDAFTSESDGDSLFDFYKENRGKRVDSNFFAQENE